MLVYLIIAAVAAVLGYVSFTDIREQRIPNKVMVPALAVALLVALLRQERWSLLLGGLVGGAMLLLPVFIYGLERAGGGDVKLAMFVGLVLGWPAIMPALLIAFVGAALVGMAGIVTHYLTRHSSIAFAPFLTLGWVATGLMAAAGLVVVPLLQ